LGLGHKHVASHLSYQLAIEFTKDSETHSQVFGVRIVEYGVGSMECGVWSHNKQAEVLEKCCQLLGTKSHSS